MPDLKTKYLGIELKNPIIVGSCGLTGNIDKIIQKEKEGAGAIILKSIFEEEIHLEYEQLLQEEPEDSGRDEYLDYLDVRIREDRLKKYIRLIKEAKAKVNIPIIGSINCSSSREWINFAKEIEKAGADALELNIYIPPSNSGKSGEETEQLYLEIAKKVKNTLKIPFSIKLSPYFTELSSMIKQLSETGVDGLVLFNKFYNPDINLNTLQIKHADALSNSQEYTLPLRWIAVNSGNVKTDLIASSGIRNGETALKMILAGATAIQIVSPLYSGDANFIANMLKEMSNWMQLHKFESLEQIKGMLAQKKISNPTLYERVQFMRYFS